MFILQRLTKLSILSVFIVLIKLKKKRKEKKKERKKKRKRNWIQKQHSFIQKSIIYLASYSCSIS